MDSPMVAQRRKSALALVFTDIVDLIAAQPPQALLSTASIAIVAGEAAFMVPAPANIALAVGAEWAYLRGIASSARGSRGWTRALNWGALALVVIYGMLWGVRKFGTDPAVALGSFWLTSLHILPVAFISFAAAMVHRSAVEAEAVERAAHEAEEHARQIQRAAEDRERERRRQAAQDAAEERRLFAMAEIEAEKAKAMARLEYRAATRTAAAQAPARPAAEETHAASQRAMTKDELYAAVRAAYAADPEFSRADMARRSGWSEAMVRKAIKETSL